MDTPSTPEMLSRDIIVNMRGIGTFFGEEAAELLVVPHILIEAHEVKYLMRRKLTISGSELYTARLRLEMQTLWQTLCCC